MCTPSNYLIHSHPSRHGGPADRSSIGHRRSIHGSTGSPGVRSPEHATSAIRLPKTPRCFLHGTVRCTACRSLQNPRKWLRSVSWAPTRRHVDRHLASAGPPASVYHAPSRRHRFGSSRSHPKTCDSATSLRFAQQQPSILIRGWLLRASHDLRVLQEAPPRCLSATPFLLRRLRMTTDYVISAAAESARRKTSIRRGVPLGKW